MKTKAQQLLRFLAEDPFATPPRYGQLSATSPVDDGLVGTGGELVQHQVHSRNMRKRHIDGAHEGYVVGSPLVPARP